MEALDRAIKAVGTQAEFARRLGVSDMVVSNWRRRMSIPPSRVRAIVDACGGAVSPNELAPGLYPPGFAFPAELPPAEAPTAPASEVAV